MTPVELILATLIYVSLLMLIAHITSRHATNQSYFIGNRKSPWLLVSYGMIGASLSGVTFMSVPGWVGKTGFSYLWMVAGYFIGYFFIAWVLLPIYYKHRVYSIYEYLEKRYHPTAQKWAAGFFILSRTLGSALRMFIVVNVIYFFIFKPWGISFATTAVIFILIVWAYSFRGGIKTIVWTDTFQTTFMLISLIFSLYFLNQVISKPNMGFIEQILASPYAYCTVTNLFAHNHWLKYLLSGAFITLTMTGLDQDMMQKNLSCRTLRESQKNMMLLPFFLLFFNILFLLVGASLYIFANEYHIDFAEPDLLFATVALQHMPWIAGVIFYLGLIAAAFSSADGTITALSTSTLVDVFKYQPDDSNRIKRLRLFLHFLFSLLFILIMLVVQAINEKSIIETVFRVASYTYGPLLGLFFFGFTTNRTLKPAYIPLVTLFPPLSLLLYQWLAAKFQFYTLGFELLPINGLMTYLMMLVFSHNSHKKSSK
ncbi:MAG: sodium:solute symporter [Bacteroidales bacterium]|nr:sodium:solute symporter [Bacteroidales bacterium]